MVRKGEAQNKSTLKQTDYFACEPWNAEKKKDKGQRTVGEGEQETEKCPTFRRDIESLESILATCVGFWTRIQYLVSKSCERVFKFSFFYYWNYLFQFSSIQFNSVLFV